jgi:two-component system, chemotaxis family, sensor kinase CheA
MVNQQTRATFAPEHDMVRKIAHQGKIIRELQELSMSLRMVPIGGLFKKMARLVRDLSHKAQKDINFVTSGEETELDRNIVDMLSDPLVHMIRNCVDHGIEPAAQRKEAGKNAQGMVGLQAFHQSGSIVIQIIDDGKGLDREKILKKAIASGLVQQGQELSQQEIFKLIFHAGLSTAEKITDISGRGVGMDVVRKNIEMLRGKIDISSVAGKGTTFSISLPLTLAIIEGQLVRVGNHRYIIPIVSIEHSLRPTEKQISTVQGKGEVANVQGRLLPVVRLYKLFRVTPSNDDPTKCSLVVIEGDGKKCCLLVDELLGQQQVVIKSLGEGIGTVQGISGGAIMGDGNVSLILDTTSLMHLAWKK